MPLGAARAILCSASAGGGGVTRPSVGGTVGTESSSVTLHQSDIIVYTVPAGIELLVLVIMYGQENIGSSGEATPTSNVDGAFTLLVPSPVFGGTGSDNAPVTSCWGLVNPTAGAHNITYGRANASSLEYSAAVAIPLNDVEVANPTGDSENTNVLAGATAVDSTLTTEKTKSLIIAWAAWQNGTNVVTEGAGEGLTNVANIATGTGSTDGVLRVSTKNGPDTPGSTSYGFDSTISSDHAYGAVEIRGVG